jgi:hypothetical protein
MSQGQSVVSPTNTTQRKETAKFPTKVNLPEQNVYRLQQSVGLTHQEIHEARLIRELGAKTPGFFWGSDRRGAIAGRGVENACLSARALRDHF